MAALHTRDDPNPYLAARREWDERHGGQIAQIRHWRWAAFIALTAAAVSSAGLVATLSERRIVPYVVKVDKLGSALAVDRAEEAAQPDRVMVVAGLARFITDMRSVYVDAAAERAILKEGYAMINRRSDAYAAMNAHMRAHDPFERAKSETATITLFKRRVWITCLAGAARKGEDATVAENANSASLRVIAPAPCSRVRSPMARSPNIRRSRD